MSTRVQTNWEPAQALMGQLLGLFAEHDLEEISDINISNGETAIRKWGLSAMVDVEVPQTLIFDLAQAMAAACDLEINRSEATLEERLPPRHRLSFSHYTIVQDGTWDLSIRFLPTKIIPLGRYIEKGEMDLLTAERLVRLMQTRTTMLISGSTGSGKSTLLRALIAEIPVRDRIVIIEDAPELNISRPNMSALKTSAHADFSKLIAHTMRKDPDIIVVGEVRDKAAQQFITIASSGHPACTTIHAAGRELALVRLHNMVKEASPNYSWDELQRAVQAVCHVQLDIDAVDSSGLPTGRRQVSLWEAAAA